MPDALIRFYNGNYFATIKASSSLASNPVFTLPINDGDNGDFFKTDGNGVTSWAAITPAAITGTSTGAATRVAVYDGTTTLEGLAALTFNGSTLTATTFAGALSGNATSATTAAGLSATLAVASGGTNATSYTKGDILIAQSSTVLSKVGVGTNGYVLTANSADNEGVVWAASGANTALSNLASVAVNVDILPGANNTYDLGSSSYQWQNIYTQDFHLNNTLRDEGNSIDGTKGNWTIQEGDENLFIVNNKTGKKYKFHLTEVA